MTPREWGKLQGFIGYAFMEDGEDTFSFPTRRSSDLSSILRINNFVSEAITISVISFAMPD